MRRFRRLIPELALVVVACGEAASREPAALLAPERASAAHRPHPATASASARPAPAPAPAVSRRLRQVTQGRYMEGSCRRGSYPGWEGFPLKRCRYSVPDRAGAKSAEVIMLNPSAKKLTRWIERACAGVAAARDTCVEALAERVIVQSSAQYPVAGIVLEDIRPADGAYEMYCFRHGVRVEIAGFVTASTDRPSADTMSLCLEGALERPTAFARIAGTTPAQYLAAGGALAVGSDAAPTPAWLEASRTLYQEAWRSDDNRLLSAWARARFGPLTTAPP
jgi:hypothetical protein